MVGTARLDDATLDEVEDALILSDLGPAAAARIRAKLTEKRFGLEMTERELKEAVAEEIAAILRPVAKPLEITAFPRPQVILVIGVNGSGKTTTIAKLAHLFQEDDYGVMLARRPFRAARSASSTLGRAHRRPDVRGLRAATAPRIRAVNQRTEQGSRLGSITAGRLQNKRELMTSWQDRRVLGRLTRAPHDVMRCSTRQRPERAGRSRSRGGG